MINFIILCSSIIISVLIVEVLLRMIKPTVAYQNLPQTIIAGFYAPSNITEFSLKKNYSGQFLMSGANFDSYIQTNEFGWRDNPPDNREKILVFGDSFTFGFGVENNEKIPVHLEEKAPEFDFINLGFVAGRSPDSHTNYLRYNQDLKNKHAIVIIYENDLNDMSNNSYFDINNKKVNLLDPNCIQVKSNRSYISDGDLVGYTDYKHKLNQFNLGWAFPLLKKSYVAGLLKDRVFTKIRKAEHQEALALVNRKNSLSSVQKIKIEESLNILQSLSKSLTIFMIESNGDSEFYSYIDQYCNIMNIRCFQIPSFERKYKWERDGHYNPEGTKKAADIIFSKLHYGSNDAIPKNNF